jgi:DNA replication protein DnaC
MKHKKNFLLWLGHPGAGKTHFCGALFEWALRNFSSFRYFKEKDLQEHLRKVMIEKGWDTHKELERLFDVDLLFLDDVGMLGHSEHKENMLFDAVDIRYNNTKPTVITSNLSMKQFREIYEPRFCSRLFSKENVVIEIMEGADYRDIET